MGLKEVFQKNPDRRYIMFGGKGGLGKTTFSAATAYWLAKQGHRVLVFSVDPQASLSDIFKKNIFGQGPVEIMPNLYAQEIDADKRIKDYQNEIRKKICDMYGLAEVPEEIENYIQAAAAEPAMEESAIFDAVVDIVVPLRGIAPDRTVGTAGKEGRCVVVVLEDQMNVSAARASVPHPVRQFVEKMRDAGNEREAPNYDAGKKAHRGPHDHVLLEFICNFFRADQK